MNTKRKVNLIKDQRGWSIAEVLIVLLMVAVIAAFTIPSLLGFVHEAEGKAYIADTRTCYIAAQVIATEETIKGTSDSAIADKIVVTNDRFANLVGPEVIGTGEDKATVSGTVTNGQVTQIVYTRNEYTVTLTPGEGSVVVRN